MRSVAIILTLILVAGCVPGYQYASKWPESPAQSQVRFEADLRDCDDPAGIYPVPLIGLPLMFVAVVALRERSRKCMETRGWRVIEKSPSPHSPRPLSDPLVNREPDPILEALPSRSQ